MASESDDAVSREKRLFDFIDYLTKHYEIDERKITTGRVSRG